MVSGPAVAGAARADLRRRPRASRPAQRDRPGDRRARGGALSAARQRRRLGGALRPRAERHRRSRRVPATAAAACRSSKASTSSRFASRSTRSAAASARADARRLLRSRSPRAAAARVPRRRQRHQSADAHRRGPAGRLRLDAHGLLPAHAAAARAQHFLCGLFNSFVVNYLVRLRVTTHVTTATVERLPIPTAETAPAAAREIAALARHLLARAPTRRRSHSLNARVAGAVSAERGRVRAHPRARFR